MSLSTLEVTILQPNPYQPREKLKKDDLADLVESIKAVGILEPLLIAQTPAGYQIIAGERRWRAAKMAGLKEVPVVIKKTTPKGMLEMALIENVQREDLNALERAQAFRRLMVEFSLQKKQIAERVGKSLPYVSNTLRLLDLPDAIKDGLTDEQITEGHARAISYLESDKEQVECYKMVLKEGASVRRTEDLVRRFKDFRQPRSAATKDKVRQITPEIIKEWQSKINPFFYTKTNLKVARTARQTKLSITLKGSVEETQTDLEKIIDTLGHSEIDE